MTAHNTIEALTNELTAKIHELNADTTVTWSSIYNKMGINYVVEKLATHGISARYSNDNGIDLILDNNKTILIRTMSNDGRVALINGDITTLKSDYLIIVTNIQFTIPNIYIVSIDNAKNMSIAAICKRDNQDEHFIDRLQYVNYKNNYDILR